MNQMQEYNRWFEMKASLEHNVRRVEGRLYQLFDVLMTEDVAWLNSTSITRL